MSEEVDDARLVPAVRAATNELWVEKQQSQMLSEE